jgi:hypothetical protein
MSHLKYKRTLTAEQAIEEELILCHIGTLESFESPWEALHALMIFHQSVGEYFAKKEGELSMTVPKGYAIVPIEPTKSMIDAGLGADSDAFPLKYIYQAMIEAAQEGE